MKRISSLVGALAALVGFGAGATSTVQGRAIPMPERPAPRDGVTVAPRPRRASRGGFRYYLDATGQRAPKGRFGRKFARHHWRRLRTIYRRQARLAAA